MTKLYPRLHSHEIVHQQIFDKIHCYYFHSFPHRYKRRNNKQNKSESESFTNISIKSKYSTDLNSTKLMYSNGIRYFYWDKYKFSKDMIDFQTNYWVFNQAANHGYCLGDWYIVRKFSSLKTEIVNNIIYSICMFTWNLCIDKARIHLQSDYCKKMLSFSDTDDYGIPVHSQITLSHITAVMLYCNYDIL
eukprot:198952_1